MDLLEKHEILSGRNVDYPKLVSSSSQFALQRPVYIGPLMILVFRASTNCPIVGLLFESQCK
jgi:hypothetical protein